MAAAKTQDALLGVTEHSLWHVLLWQQELSLLDAVGLHLHRKSSYIHCNRQITLGATFRDDLFMMWLLKRIASKTFCLYIFSLSVAGM